MRSKVRKVRRKIKETSVLIQSDDPSAINAAVEAIRHHRIELETYISLHPAFPYTLLPIPVEPNAPRIVKTMSWTCGMVNIGPMAAVAGALADLAVESMIATGTGIAIVENGGEVSAQSREAFIVGLYAGNDFLPNDVSFQILPSDCPVGIGTSSSTIGHAISFGEADAVTVFADSATVADAAATAICNAVRGKDVKESVEKGLDFARGLDFIRGAMIIRGKYAGIIGKIAQFVKMVEGRHVDRLSLSDAWPHSVLCMSS